MSDKINCQSERTEILALLRSTFARKSPPASEVTSAGTADQGVEYSYSRNFFAGRKWQEIECAEVLQKYPSGASAMLTFLSDEGFAYYLPLFMSCVLDAFDESGSLLESLLAELAPSNPTGSQKPVARNIEMLSAEEKECVARFLNYLATCHSAELPEEIYQDIAPKVILSRFWSAFLK